MEEKRQRAEEIKAHLDMHFPNLTFNVHVDPPWMTAIKKRDSPEVTILYKELNSYFEIDEYLEYNVLEYNAIKSELVHDLVDEIEKSLEESSDNEW